MIFQQKTTIFSKILFYFIPLEKVSAGSKLRYGAPSEKTNAHLQGEEEGLDVAQHLLLQVHAVVREPHAHLTDEVLAAVLHQSDHLSLAGGLWPPRGKYPPLSGVNAWFLMQHLSL